MRQRNAVMIAVVFVLGIAVGAFAAKKGVDKMLYSGKDKKEAAAALLDLATSQAGKGSWENIAVGRVHYLGGDKAAGQAIFDGIKKKEGSDWMRIGRIYVEAKEWDKAKEAFDQALQLEKKDAPWLAEVGGYYNMHGEREAAEEMFDRSFSIESKEFWSTINIAGSYVGVKPQ